MAMSVFRRASAASPCMLDFAFKAPQSFLCHSVPGVSFCRGPVSSPRGGCAREEGQKAQHHCVSVLLFPTPPTPSRGRTEKECLSPEPVGPRRLGKAFLLLMTGTSQLPFRCLPSSETVRGGGTVRSGKPQSLRRLPQLWLGLQTTPGDFS